MDPISTALIAAATAGVTKIGEQAIVEAYNSLKALIVRRFGTDSKVMQAVKDLEEEPQSESLKALVAERIANSKLGEEPGLLKAAEALLLQLKQSPATAEHARQAAEVVGNFNRLVQLQGNRNVVNLGDRPA